MTSIELKMAWRNIWRNPRRSILTMLAVAFACLLLIFMLSWQFGSYETMINSTVKIQTGHIQVQALEFREKNDIRLAVQDPAAIIRILKKTAGINAYTLRSKTFSLISSKNRTCGAMVIGIDPVREGRMSPLKKLVRKGRYFSSDDSNQAIIGSLLAKNLRVNIGDELIILGQGFDGSVAASMVKVKGIFNSGQDDFDRGLVHIPLKFFEAVYAMRGAVHEVVVTANSLKEVAEIKKKVAAGLASAGLKTKLVVLDWKQLMPGLIEAIKMDLVSGLIFYVILIVVVAFSILNTFLMAIFERTREFGILMALGISAGKLTRLLLLESMTMTLLGVFIGAIAGSLITSYFQAHGIVIPGSTELLRQYGLPERMHPRLSLLSASIGAGIVLLITSLTALYPALKVRRLRPLEAMMSA